MDLINEVIETVRKEGSCTHAAATFGDQIKMTNWTPKLKELFALLAQLIEEEDAVIYNLLRVLYLCEAPGFIRKDVVLTNPPRRNLLESAIYSENWNIANFLVKFAVERDAKLLEKDEFWEPQLECKATPDQWGKALQLMAKSCASSRVLQGGVSNSNLAHLWTARLKIFKSVIENGYVNLLDLLKYPSAFMLMVRLGADLPPQNTKKGYNMTLPYCVWSSRMKKHKRIHLLRFLDSVDPTLFDVPCGPNNVKLAYECWKASDLAIIRSVSALSKTKIDMHMKDRRGRGIGDYLHPKKILADNFKSEERFDYAVTAVVKGKIPVINYLFQLDTGAVTQFFCAYPELMKALEILILKDKQVLSKLLETTTDQFLVAYCMAQGHKPPQNNVMWPQLAAMWEVTPKEYEVRTVSELVLQFDKDQRCHIHELPDDVISLILPEISFADVMNLFAASKTMQQVCKRLTSPSLWKKIAANNFNGFKMKYLDSQPITDWRSHVIKEMRWRKNWIHQRFTERTIFTELDGDFQFATDDNWFVMTSSLPSGLNVYCWNCHTFQSYTMELSYVLGEVLIIDSTPSSLTIALVGFSLSLNETFILILDPVNNRFVKEIKPCVHSLGAPFLIKFRSKLCFVSKDLQEVDIEAGVTKSIWNLNGKPIYARMAAVNINEDSLLLVRSSRNSQILILDPDLNLVAAAEDPPNSSTVLSAAFFGSGSAFITIFKHLEFGQWYGHLGSDTVYNSILDAQNNRLLIKQSAGGISMLLHPNLKTWYTAWIETPEKFVAKNSRYLFIYNKNTGCISCRDFDWQ